MLFITKGQMCEVDHVEVSEGYSGNGESALSNQAVVGYKYYIENGSVIKVPVVEHPIETIFASDMLQENLGRVIKNNRVLDCTEFEDDYCETLCLLVNPLAVKQGVRRDIIQSETDFIYSDGRLGVEILKSNRLYKKEFALITIKLKDWYDSDCTTVEVNASDLITKVAMLDEANRGKKDGICVDDAIELVDEFLDRNLYEFTKMFGWEDKKVEDYYYHDDIVYQD